MEPVPEDIGGLLPRETLTPEERRILLGEQQSATTSRATDALIRWYIAPAMIAANVTLSLFALPRVINGELIGGTISITSVLLVYLWYQLEMRIYGLIEYWNRKLVAIAGRLQPRERVYGGVDWERDVRNVKWTTHNILLLTIRIFAILGAATIIFVIIANVKPDFFPAVPTPSTIERRLRKLEEKIEKGTLIGERMNQLEKQMEEIEEGLRALKPPNKQAPPKPKRGTKR